MNIVLLSFSLGPQLGYSHQKYGKEPLFLETNQHREPPRREVVCRREQRSHGQHEWLFLGFIGSCVFVLLLFFPFHCEEHSPWRKQALPSSPKAVCYSSCLITNYVTSTHLNPRAEGLQTFRESDEAAKSQFTLNISQIATNHRQSPLCSSGSGAMSNLVNQCPCCHCSPGEHRTCGGRR